MACKKARLMICGDPWSSSAVVNALVELVFSVLVLLSSLLFFLTVTFGQTFNLHRPSLREGRRPERQGAGRSEVTVLCEHHAKQISSLRSSVSHIAAGMSSVCELCALSLVYCSCKGPDSGSQSRNLDSGIAVKSTRNSADDEQPGTQAKNGFTSGSLGFCREDTEGSDELVLGSMENAKRCNKGRNKAGGVEFDVCPTCGLAVMAAAYEKRSVKRKLGRVSADELRAPRAERGSMWEGSAAPVGHRETSLLDLDQQNPVPRQEEHGLTEDGMVGDFDQLCRYTCQGKGSLSRSNSYRVGADLSIARGGSFSNASHQESESFFSELDPDGNEEDNTMYNISSEGNDLSALYMELEQERNASATAASEAMAMITRLQEEKARLQMEARHYQQMAEEKSVYDNEAISLLQEILTRKDEELSALASEVKIYRRKLLAGNWTSDMESLSGTDEYDQNFRLQHKGKKLDFSDTGDRIGQSEIVDNLADADSSQVVLGATDGSVVAPGVADVLENRDQQLMDTSENENLNQKRATESIAVKDEKKMDLLDSVGQSALTLPLAQKSSEIVRPSEEVTGRQVPNFTADAFISASSAAGNSSTTGTQRAATQARKLFNYVASREDSNSVQTANEIVKSRERFLDALKSSAALSLLEEEHQSGELVERSTQEVARVAETARNIVLEEHRLSVLEYVRKFEGQLGRKITSQPTRGSPGAGSSRISQKEQLVAKDEATELVQPETARHQKDLVPSGQVDPQHGHTQPLLEDVEGSRESVVFEEQDQELGTVSALKELDTCNKSQGACSDQTKVSSAVTPADNAACLTSRLVVDVDEFGWKNNDAESLVLDVYEVSSGYATDQRPDSEISLPYYHHDSRGNVLIGSGARSSRQSRAHDAGNRLGKPDAHPEVVSDQRNDSLVSRMRGQNTHGSDVECEQPALDFGAAYALEGSGISQGVRPAMYGNEDWRTPSMVSRDAYRMMMEEEALCLISRLESVEADRQAMRQTIDSLRRENGEMKVLQEIAQQLRELRGLEKKSIRTPEPWQQEEPSGTSLFKGMSFTRLRCTVQAQLNKIARLFLRNSDTGASPGDQVGLRLLQSSPPPPAATCITRGVKADSSIKGHGNCATPGIKADGANGQSSLTSLLMSGAPSRPADCWVVDAGGRHGTALGGWYY